MKLKAINDVTSYRYLVKKFIKEEKNRLLTSNQTFMKAVEDYEAAFNYIDGFSSF